MESLVEFVREHPLWALSALPGLVGVYFWMRRKPKLERDAERELAALTKEKAGKYDHWRPPG